MIVRKRDGSYCKNDDKGGVKRAYLKKMTTILLVNLVKFLKATFQHMQI